jgi:hypothetical protein
MEMLQLLISDSRIALLPDEIKHMPTIDGGNGRAHLVGIRSIVSLQEEGNAPGTPGGRPRMLFSPISALFSDNQCSQVSADSDIKYSCA